MCSLVSVIIPFYNSENYLYDCLQSVRKQTYRNIEIILVDDGSRDGSYEICEKELKKDQRIKLFSQENGGVSKARNLGIDNAKGKYICFVDSDDLVMEDFIEKMINFIDKADIVICGFIKLKEDEKKYILEDRGLLSEDKVYYNTMCNNMIGLYSVNKMYKTSIINKYNIRFKENIAVGEDMVFLTTYYHYCKSFFYINEPLYTYKINQTSVMQGMYTLRKFNYKSLTVLEAIDNILDITKEESKTIRNYVSYRVVRSSMWLFIQMIFGNQYDKNILKKIKKNCRQNYYKFLIVKTGKGVEKIVALSLCFFPYVVYTIALKVLNRKPKVFARYID